MTAVFIREVAGEKVELSLDNLQVFEQVAAPGETYNIVDKATGLTPQDVTATRLLDDLVIYSESLDLEVRIKDFWANCQPGDDQCFFTMDIPTADGTMGQVTITQSDHELEFLLAGEVGTLVEEVAIAPWLLGLGALVAAALAGGSSKPKDTSAPSEPTVEIQDGGDGVLNADEIAAGVKVKITPPGDAEVGDKLAVDTDGDGEPDVTKELTAEDIENGVVVEVPEEDVPADGELTVVATVTDKAGNTSAPGTDTATTDSTNPKLTARLDPESDTGDKDDGITNDDTPTISGTGEPGATVEVTTPTGETLTTTVDEDGTWRVTPTDPIPEGEQTFPVKETDPAGNTTETEVPVTIDTTAPSQPVVEIQDGDDGYLNADEVEAGVTVKITPPTDAAVGDTLDVDTDGDGEPDFTKELTADDIKDGVSVSVPAEDIKDGETLTVTATVTDPAGNTSPKGEDSSKVDASKPNDGLAPTVEITDDVNNDGFINREELATDGNDVIDVKVGFDGDKVDVGDTVVITDNTDPANPTEKSVVVTQADKDNGYVTTDFVKPAEGSNIVIDAFITDNAGNQTEEGQDTAKLDTSDLTAEGGVTIKILDDANGENGEGDGLISADELGDDGIQVEVGLPKEAVAGDKLLVKATGNPDQEIILTEAQVIAGKVNLDFPAPANGIEFITTAQVTDPAGNQSNIAEDKATLKTDDPNAPSVTIVEDANNDGYINADESKGDVDVLIKVPEGTQVGDTLTVKDNAGNTETIPVTQEIIENGASVTFPTPEEGEEIAVVAIVTDAAGNPSPEGTDTAILDTSDLSTGLAIEITEDENNDGLISIDELKDNDIDVKVTLPKEAAEGDTLTITGSGNNPQTVVLTQEQVTAGTVEVSFNPLADGADFVTTATIKDAAGNEGGPVKDAAKMQLSAPGEPIVTIAEDENNDGYINADELNGDIDISVALPATAKVGDTLNLDTNGDGTPDQTKVLELSDIQSGNVSFTTPVPSPQEGVTITAEAWVTDPAGNAGEKGSDEAVIDTVIPSTAPIVEITDDVNNDGFINREEIAADGNDVIDVKVSFEADKVDVGDTVVITDNTDPANPTEKSVVVTQADKDNGYVTTDFVKPAEGSNIVVNAFIKDPAGNQTEEGQDTAKLDTSDLTAEGGVTIKILDDANGENGEGDGLISADELGDDGIQVEVGLPKEAVAGDKLLVKATGNPDQEIILTEAQVTAGKVNLDFPAPANGTEFVTTAQVTDPAGNQSNVAEDKATLKTDDPNAPTVTIVEDTNNDISMPRNQTVTWMYWLKCQQVHKLVIP